MSDLPYIVVVVAALGEGLAETMIRLLARPYADLPGWREEWTA